MKVKPRPSTANLIMGRLKKRERETWRLFKNSAFTDQQNLGQFLAFKEMVEIVKSFLPARLKSDDLIPYLRK